MKLAIPDVQARFRKSREPEIKMPASVASWRKQESSRKTSTSALLTIPKPLTVWITAKCGKFFKIWEYQTTLLASLDAQMPLYASQEATLEPTMEQQTGSK